MKNRTERKLILCRYCAEEIRSREPLYIGKMVMDMEEAEEQGKTCEWCGEVDDLYECIAD